MKRFVLNGTVAAIALLSATSAFATDYNSGVVTKTPSDTFTEVEFGSGWYLRGDISFNLDGRGRTTFQSIPDLGRNVQADYDDAFGVRAGFGYYVTPKTRLELSVESVLDTDFDAFTTGLGFAGSRDITAIVGGLPTAGTVSFDNNGVATGSTVGIAPGTNVGAIGGTENFEATYSAFNLILNAYYDLESIGAFTPYVGIGGGVSRIELNQRRTLQCNAGTGETCSIGDDPLVLTLDEEFWTYAYQFSVGTAIAVDDRTSIDLSYSYTGVGDGDDLNYDDGTAIDEDGFKVHQVRAGIRYDIW